MLLRRYDSTEAFKSDVSGVLIENEVQNNLTLILTAGSQARRAADWFLATISSGKRILLTALYIEPFALQLYETGNVSSGGAVELLAEEMRRGGLSPSGVVAEPGLARRFADAMAGRGAGRLHQSIYAMRMDEPAACKLSPGHPRALEKSDLRYVPYWERAFSEACRSHVFPIPEYAGRLRERLGKSAHFIWVDGVPVSQAVHGRDTPNGAVITEVYTPPRFRGLGYASSVVSELTRALLESGKRFCCLFADADNPVSCGMYRKLGFYEVCGLQEIRFDI